MFAPSRSPAGLAAAFRSSLFSDLAAACRPRAFDAGRATRPSIRRSQRIEEVTQYLRAKNVPARLRYEITDFYSFKFENEVNDSEGVLADLPPILQMKVDVSLKKRTIASVKLFEDIDPLFMLTILNTMKQVIVLPSQLITKQWEVGHSMYVIQQGRISVWMNHTLSALKRRRLQELKSVSKLNNDASHEDNDNNSEVWRNNFRDFHTWGDVLVGTLAKQDYFGEKALIRQSDEFTARCDTYCELSVIPAKPFKQLMAEARVACRARLARRVLELPTSPTRQSAHTST